MSTTSLASNLTSAAHFLIDHPHLPTPWGASFMSDGGLTVSVDDAAQVTAWAEVIDGQVTVLTATSGAVVHSVYTFKPFYISVTYVDRTNEVKVA